MRLTNQHIQYIRTQLKSLAPDSQVYVFGSRVDDTAKGGDIDILWLTNETIPNKTKRLFKIGFYKKFGWQKVDLVNFTFSQKDVFKDIALNQAVEL